MKSRLLYILISACFGLFFLIFTYIVKKDKLTNFDFDTTIKIQDRLPLSFDSFLSFMSLLASFEIMLFLLSSLLIFLFFRRKFFSPLILGLFALGHIIEIYGKVFIDHQSPPMKLLREYDNTTFPDWYAHPVSSYPSGHALRATFIASILLFMIYRSNKIPNLGKYAAYTFIISFVFLVLFSRVSLGTHWTTDIIGGFFLGGGLGILSLIFI